MINARCSVIAIALTLFPATTLASQVHAATSDEQRLAQIRKWSTETTADLSHDSTVKRTLSGFSAEGGEFTAYFASNSLRKIDARVYSESGRAHEELFFRDGKAFLVLDTEDRYTPPPKHDVIGTTHSRTSFDGDRLIEWIDAKGQSRAVNSKDADELSEAIRWMAHAFAECAQRHEKPGECVAPPPPTPHD